MSTDSDALYIAHGRRGLATGSAKGTEILFPQQELGLSVHQLNVQGAALPRYLAVQQGGTDTGITNDIAVTTGQGRKSGVKLRGNYHRP